MFRKVKESFERLTGVYMLRRDRDFYKVMYEATERVLGAVRQERELFMRQRDLARDERDAAHAACERWRVDRDRSLADREAQIQAKLNALRWVDNLNAELETARRTAALHRSLIAILRDVNRDLDERLNALESKPEVEATT